MEFENFCDGSEGWQTKSRANPWLRSPSDKKLDVGNLVRKAGEYRQDGGCRLFVSALVEGVDDDESRDVGGFKWTDNDPLHLGAEGLLSDIRVHLQYPNQFFSEMWILISELEGECREDFVEIAPVLEVSRTEEARAELSTRKARLGKRLGDGRLSRPGEAV